MFRSKRFDSLKIVENCRSYWWFPFFWFKVPKNCSKMKIISNPKGSFINTAISRHGRRREGRRGRKGQKGGAGSRPNVTMVYGNKADEKLCEEMLKLGSLGKRQGLGWGVSMFIFHWRHLWTVPKSIKLLHKAYEISAIRLMPLLPNSSPMKVRLDLN